MHTVENAVVNDLLCFVSTARNTFTADNIVLNVVGFYKDEDIKKAKATLYQICRETPVNRKQCASQPNPSVSHTKDIIQLFEKAEREETDLPKFLASGFMSLPPSTGFESFASVVCSLRDEITALRLEVTEVRKASEKDSKSMENVNCIIQDVAEIKLLLHSSPNRTISNQERTADGNSARAGIQPQQDSDQQDSDRNENSAARSSTTAGDRLPGSYAGAVSDSAVRQNLQRRNVQAARSTESYGLHLAPNEDYNDASEFRGSQPWQVQGGARRGRYNRAPARRINIAGTRTTTSAGLSAAPRVLDVYVGGCGLETNVDNLSSFCNEQGVNLQKCELLPSRAQWCRAYKISVDADAKDTVFSAEFWPEGIYVRRFFNARNTMPHS